MENKLKVLLTTVLLFVAALSCDERKYLPTPPTEPPKPPGYQEDIPWPSLADSPWPMYHHDPQNTGRSNLNGPVNGQIIDSIPAYNLQAGVVVGPDSTIYFITSNPAILKAVDFQGNINWERLIAVESVTTPLIDANNIIYAAGGKELFAFDNSGDFLWKFICDGTYFVSTSPNIDKKGNLYILDNTHTLYSVSPQGELNWRLTDQRIPTLAIHSPAFSPDGNTLYIQGSEVSLLAIDINYQSIKWEFGDTILYLPPVVDNDGNIYIIPGGPLQGLENYMLLSLNPDGLMRWSYAFETNDNGSLFEGITIDQAGNLYFGVDKLISVSFWGTLNWSLKLNNDNIDTEIISDYENNIIFGSSITLYSYNSKSQLNWIVAPNSFSWLSNPIIAAPGVLLVFFKNEDYIFIIN